MEVSVPVRGSGRETSNLLEIIHEFYTVSVPVRGSGRETYEGFNEAEVVWVPGFRPREGKWS